MKLATLKSQQRDGIPLLVNDDLTRAIKIDDHIPNLQALIENWSEYEETLVELYEQLNSGECEQAFAVDMKQLASPLPRAYQWLDGSAYVNHVELVRKARGAEMPQSFWTDPLMYQGGSDHFVGPCDAIEIADPAWGIDFEAEVVVVTDDVPMGVSVEQAASHIKWIMIVNDVSLRNLIPNEIAKGFGFLQSKPASSFSPVCVTPDELGDAWADGKLHLALYSYLNGDLFGKPNAGIDMTFNFPTLIAHAAKTRHLSAGTIIGSGTVSNTEGDVGSSCIAEKRMLEIIADGEATTPFMQCDDVIKIEMRDEMGQSIFGAIEQRVVA